MHLFNFTDNQRELLAYQANNALFLSNKKIIIQKWVDYLNGKKKIKEQSLDAEFSHDLFVELLGYTEPPKSPHSYIRQRKNEANSGKPDATLGYFSMSGEDEVHAVFELKTVGVNLDKIQRGRKPEISPVQQAFDYANAHSERCRWIIVSNFEEIRIYHRSTGYLKYETFNFIELLTDDTLNRFLFILSSNQLFWRGDKKSPMDNLFEQRRALEKNITESFYRDYKRLRTELLYNIQQQNLNTLFEGKNINALQFLSVTQKLVDRLIFMCFVRFSLNIRNTLQESIDLVNKLPAHDDYLLWEIIKKLFKSYDIGYNAQIPPFNGGLFAPDSLLENLIVTNVYLEPFIKFILGYNFRSELNANILGHIFEQSISDLEEIKANIIANGGLFLMNASVDATSKTDLSKRKKEGVFYTPDYITHYIIENTVGQWIQEKEDALFLKHGEENKDYWQEYQNCLSQIKILDPACGSGAFLTQCFDFLWQKWQISIKELDKIENTNGHVVSKKDSFIFETSSTFNKDKIRKSIVENNLFGVDLNAESVEITKLSLWLLLANKNVPLPNLDKNIQQGNSLIDDPSVVEQDAFVWHERFEHIMANDGFDVVVGNPPYVRQELLSENQQLFFQKQYPAVFNGIADLYVFFYERSLSILKQSGYLGFITPNKWFKTKYGRGLRTYLQPFEIQSIIDFFELRIFDDASTEPQIITLKNTQSDKPFPYFAAKNIEQFINREIHPLSIRKTNLRESEWVFADDTQQSILEKMKVNTLSLKDYTNGGVKYGIKTGLNKAFIIDKKTKDWLIKQDPKSADIIKPYIQPTDIHAWHLENNKTSFLLQTGFDTDISASSYTSVFNYLRQFDDQLEKRSDKGLTKYNLRPCDYYEDFNKEKILFIHTALKHQFYFDRYNYFINNSSCLISNADIFLSCFLNSDIFTFYKKLTFAAFGDSEDGGRSRLNHEKMIHVPIPNLNPEEKRPYTEKAVFLREWSETLYEREMQFIEALTIDYPILNRDRFRHWYARDFSDFMSVIKRQKLKMDRQKQLEWQQFFKELQEPLLDLQQKIRYTEYEMNDMFFTLYNLTETEKATVRKF